MGPEPDWLALWSELVALQAGWRARRPEGDAWAGRAGAYRERVRRRWTVPDSSRETVCSWLEPGLSVLDVGAGSGAWAALFARRGARVTALEPSESMIESMEEGFREEGVHGVRILRGCWPETEVEPHDMVFCSHALYGCTDLRGFVLAMERAARRRCALLLRATLPGAPMAEAARLVLGQPHDSPNFAVAFNALLQLGRFPDVHMEAGEPWRGWHHASFEEALDEARARLGLGAEPSRHDAALRALLARRLEQGPRGWDWPPGVRSALVWWDPGR